MKSYYAKETIYLSSWGDVPQQIISIRWKFDKSF